MNKESRSLLEIHAAVLLFGFPGLFGKWLDLAPHEIVLGRVLFASLTLALLLVLSRRGLSIRPSGDAVLLILCGAVLAVHWTAFFRSVQVSTVAVGLLSYSSFPLFTVLLEPLMLKERINVRNLALSALIIPGVYLIVPRFDLSDSVFKGVLWGLLAGATFAILTILNRRLSQRHSSLTVAFYQDLAAALFLIPSVLSSSPRLGIREVLLLAILGVFCTAAAHTLFIQGMKRIRAQTASLLSALEPVYGILLALIFLGEIPSPRTVGGGAVILAAALTVSLGASGPSGVEKMG